MMKNAAMATIAMLSAMAVASPSYADGAAASASATMATPADVDARLQAFAAKLNAQQPGNADGRVTSAVAGHLNITLNMVSSRDISLESDAQGQAEVRQLVCGTPAFRGIVDRYGVTFHFVYSAPNWLTPIKATVTPSDCADPANGGPRPVIEAAPISTATNPVFAITQAQQDRLNIRCHRWHVRDTRNEIGPGIADEGHSCIESRDVILADGCREIR